MPVIVREAETEDILETTKLLKEFSSLTPIKGELVDHHFHAPTVARMVTYCMTNGCVIVAEDTKNQDIVGVIMGIIQTNLWTEMSKEMREIAWYVKKDHRESGVGVDLYNRYVEISDYYTDEGIVYVSWMTTMSNSGPMVEGLVKRDFQPMQTSYFRGG